jgi:hypothetical protein
MLGLEGIAVSAVAEGDREIEYAVETTTVPGWCPVCGARSPGCMIDTRRGFLTCRPRIER